MKKFCLLIAASFTAAFTYAQNVMEAGPGLSTMTKKYLHEIKKERDAGKLPTGYAYRKLNNGVICVSALIKVSSPALAQSGIESTGAVTGTKAGNIWTVQVPVTGVEAFCQLPGISFIELDQPVFPDLNIARQTTRVDSVHAGINLPVPFSGKGVVIGVIDFGFDYNHPTFYDTTHSAYRIKRVWELHGTGNPPAGYTYGNEITDTVLIKAQGTDNVVQTHGTATAGIAGGSGYGSTPQANRFRGMAYESEFVLVGVNRDTIAQQWMQGSFSDFLDGVNYIFSYADTVGKPAVVNISWGSQSGPHDGTTLFNQACNNLSGPGRIIVMSAGNEGEEKIHLTKTFTASDTIVNTFLAFSSDVYQRTWVDTWGEPGKTFCGVVTLWHNGLPVTTTGVQCIDDSIHDQVLIASGGDTCFVQFLTESATFNGKPRLTIDIYNTSADSVGVSLIGNDGTIHAWNEYYYYGYDFGYQCWFDSLQQPWAVSGNTVSTVSDMGAADSVLLVGAYCSKTNFTDINGNNWTYSGYVLAGRLVPFSSRGPMIDGRIKPDINAPGMTICTSMSSYDSAYTPTGASSQLVIKSWFDASLNKTFYYCEFSGTSASAPCASGIIALMMQAYPDLSARQARDIIAATAITDLYTGAIPPQGNNNWGHGKINAYQAIKLLLLQTGIYQAEGVVPDCVLFPNPNDGVSTLHLQAAKKESYRLEVYDAKGSCMKQDNWKVQPGENTYNLDLTGTGNGLYLVKVANDKGSVTMKTIVK